MVLRHDKSYHEIVAQLERGLQMLTGHNFYFYGCHNNCFKLDDMILEALEDPEDGYRSSLGGVRHVLDEHENRFFKRPLGRVVLKEYVGGSENTQGWELNSENIQGWELKDIDTGHQWLVFGTSDFDDYYPYFVFNYKPDQTQTKFPEIDQYYEPFKERYPELVLKYPDWFAGVTIEMGY